MSARRVPLALVLQIRLGRFASVFGFAWLAVLVCLPPDLAADWQPAALGAIPAVLAIGYAAMHARRELRLVRRGIETRGKLVKRHYKHGDPETIYLDFEYEIAGKKYTTRVEPEDERELSDEAEEPMVYDPKDPAHAVMLDDLPGRPRIVDGELQARRLSPNAMISIVSIVFLVIETTLRLT